MTSSRCWFAASRTSRSRTPWVFRNELSKCIDSDAQVRGSMARRNLAVIAELSACSPAKISAQSQGLEASPAQGPRQLRNFIVPKRVATGDAAWACSSAHQAVPEVEPRLLNPLDWAKRSERSPPDGAGRCRQPTIVVFDDCPANPQPHPQALCLCRKERLENLIDILFVDARSRVRNRYHHIFLASFDFTVSTRVRLRHIAHRLHGIQHEFRTTWCN